MGELWDVFYKYLSLRESWLCYNGTALYVGFDTVTEPRGPRSRTQPEILAAPVLAQGLDARNHVSQALCLEHHQSHWLLTLLGISTICLVLIQGHEARKHGWLVLCLKPHWVQLLFLRLHVSPNVLESWMTQTKPNSFLIMTIVGTLLARVRSPVCLRNQALLWRI